MQAYVSNNLRGFHEFVGEKLSNGGADLSPEDALDEWRRLNPSPEELGEGVAAVRQALADMAGGDRGRAVDEVLAEVRARHKLPSA